MQKSRCRRGLELHLLPLGLLAACAGQPAAASPPVTPTPPPTAESAPSATPSGGPAASSAASPAPVSAAATDAPAPSAPAPANGAAAPVDAALPKGTLVLHIGDSFAAALGVELGKRLKAAGVRNALEYKTASYIPNWSFGKDIPSFIAKYQPDLVLITLGANEIEIPEPQQRAGAIKHLVSELGGRPCVWVAPPLWKPDTGLLKVIQENVAPCRYLDSNALVHDLPRGRDKIHPNPEGREIWAGIVFDWLAKERVGSAKQPWALRPESAAPAN